MASLPISPSVCRLSDFLFTSPARLFQCPHERLAATSGLPVPIPQTYAGVTCQAESLPCQSIFASLCQRSLGSRHFNLTSVSPSSATVSVVLFPSTPPAQATVSRFSLLHCLIYRSIWYLLNFRLFSLMRRLQSQRIRLLASPSGYHFAYLHRCPMSTETTAGPVNHCTPVAIRPRIWPRRGPISSWQRARGRVAHRIAIYLAPISHDMGPGRVGYLSVPIILNPESL